MGWARMGWGPRGRDRGPSVTWTLRNGTGRAGVPREKTGGSWEQDRLLWGRVPCWGGQGTLSDKDPQGWGRLGWGRVPWGGDGGPLLMATLREGAGSPGEGGHLVVGTFRGVRLVWRRQRGSLGVGSVPGGGKRSLSDRDRLGWGRVPWGGAGHPMVVGIFMGARLVWGRILGETKGVPWGCDGVPGGGQGSPEEGLGVLG